MKTTPGSSWSLMFVVAILISAFLLLVDGSADAKRIPTRQISSPPSLPTFTTGNFNGTVQLDGIAFHSSFILDLHRQLLFVLMFMFIFIMFMFMFINLLHLVSSKRTITHRKV